VVGLMRTVLALTPDDEVGFWSPPTDVYETEEGVVVAVEIAGVQTPALSVSLEKDVLTVTGVREEPVRSRRRNYHKMEMRFGPFLRRIRLPCSVSVARARAVYEQGVLTVVLPRAGRSPAGTVEVRIS
jgi:HSP20 family protein